MKPLKKIYELTYNNNFFYVHKKINFFGITINKVFLKKFKTPETAIKYMKSLK